MTKAVLIAFKYQVNILYGALVDLYHAYKWCKSFGCDITMITDFSAAEIDINDMRAVIKKDYADDDLLDFYHQNSIQIVHNEKEFLSFLGKILDECTDERLIVYYSGHGVKDHLIMPDQNPLFFLAFRDTIINNLAYKVEIFCILDCCNPDGLYLPYKLINNTFRLSDSKIECIPQPFILITSSDQNEKSIATKYGSIFSRNLFRYLFELNYKNHKNRNLRRLIGKISSLIREQHNSISQTVSIYSSYLFDPVLWMWIGSNKNYDIAIDPSLSTLIIRSIK